MTRFTFGPIRTELSRIGINQAAINNLEKMGAPIRVLFNGVLVEASPTGINFVGDGLTVTTDSAGLVTVALGITDVTDIYMLNENGDPMLNEAGDPMMVEG